MNFVIIYSFIFATIDRCYGSLVLFRDNVLVFFVFARSLSRTLIFNDVAMMMDMLTTSPMLDTTQAGDMPPPDRRQVVSRCMCSEDCG